MGGMHLQIPKHHFGRAVSSTSSVTEVSMVSESSIQSSDGDADVSVTEMSKTETNDMSDMMQQLSVERNYQGSRAASAASSMSGFRPRNKSKLQLTEEQSRKVKAAFEKFDVDGSGRISKSEFVLAMRSLRFDPASKSEEDALFRGSDLNKDGRIDYNEFLKFLTAKLGSRVVPGVSVHLKRAEGLVPARGNRNVNNPYAVLTVGKFAKYTTKPRKKTSSPVYDEHCFLPCPENCTAKLVIKIFGGTKIFRLDGRLEKEYLGGIEVDIEDLTEVTKELKVYLWRLEETPTEAPAGSGLKDIVFAAIAKDRQVDISSHRVNAKFRGAASQQPVSKGTVQGAVRKPETIRAKVQPKVSESRKSEPRNAKNAAVRTDVKQFLKTNEKQTVSILRTSPPYPN